MQFLLLLLFICLGSPMIQDEYGNRVIGADNKWEGRENTIMGASNRIQGDSNQVKGANNYVRGSNNYVGEMSEEDMAKLQDQMASRLQSRLGGLNMFGNRMPNNIYNSLLSKQDLLEPSSQRPSPPQRPQPSYQSPLYTNQNSNVQKLASNTIDKNTSASENVRQSNVQPQKEKTFEQNSNDKKEVN